jgi:hypothetical protein
VLLNLPDHLPKVHDPDILRPKEGQIMTTAWPPRGTVPTHEDNRGMTSDGRRYKYSSEHNGFILLDTPEDLAYEAGVNDGATEIITGESVYTGPGSMCTLEEAFAYMDGMAWAWNHREEVTL